MPVTETPAAVSLRDWANGAPEDAASRVSSNGSGPLLRSFLEHHQELDLDSAQIAELSRLYWSKPLPTVAETIAVIEQRLSPEQFRKSIGYIAAVAGQAIGSASSTSQRHALVRVSRPRLQGRRRRLASPLPELRNQWLGFLLTVPAVGARRSTPSRRRQWRMGSEPIHSIQSWCTMTPTAEIKRPPHQQQAATTPALRGPARSAQPPHSVFPFQKRNRSPVYRLYFMDVPGHEIWRR
jgi:hypothetical protein